MKSRNSYLLRRFGITEQQYEDLLRKQGGACAVCNRPATLFKARLAVDHDHKTGEVRGILCLFCNRFLVGRHRKGFGAELLRSAYEYLTRDYPGWIVPPKKKRRKNAKKLRAKNRGGRVE